MQIESTHTLNLDGFVEKSEIDQIYLDTPYYLAPADEVSEEAFAVIRDALAGKKMAGMARIVLYRRERPVVIEARDRGMLLTTLRYDKHGAQAGRRSLAHIDKVKTDSEMIELASHIIDQEDRKFDPVEIRRQIRGRAARPDQGQEGRQEGAGVRRPRRSRPTSSICSMR